MQADSVAASDMPVYKIAWGVNHLYFIDSANQTIGRTTAAGPADRTTFVSLETAGKMHAVAPALATSVSVTTSTTIVVTTTTSTVAATTTTLPPAPTTTVAAKTAPTIGKSGTTAKSIAAFLGLGVPSGAKLKATVAAKSKRYCKVTGSKVVALKTGSCRVTLTVTPKGGKSKSMSTTLKVKK